ncbi:ATP-binding cassette domain-containing protein [Streptomyces albidoflavus]|uniref:ATP-binding cassette domain-containing protein n=1 Tax=Streptomyces albidoflavus TaxID=1886 RepID=UPI0001AEDAD2|nr:ATP-binding cassette domain-containing protein [Streptomyces albidoflavus]
MAVSAPAPVPPLLAVEGLRLAATASGTPVPLLDGVSLTVGRGESVAIVGESGSGKSLTMRAAMGLLPDGVEVTGGTVRLDGTDLLTLPPRERAALRGHRMSLLLQDPFTMLHPQLTCGRQIADGLRPGFAAPGGGRARRAAVRAEVVRRLAEDGLDAASADRNPHELSGEHAPARRHSRGPRRRPGPAHRRRAHHRPGRRQPARRPRPPRRAARPPRHGPGPRHPRPARRLLRR